MADIKLFQLNAESARAMSPRSPEVEKSLQTLFERNLETILGVRFLASEFGTGPVHGGRIDTLGIDEDGSPVIIEYKRTTNENVINQGLFYLDWLMDHRRDFQWLVLESLGKDVAEAVDWSAPRLICIAGDFTRYDGYAVKQIARNIELIRYRRFEDDILLVELVHAPRITGSRATAARSESSQKSDAVTGINQPISRGQYANQRIDYRLANADMPLREIWDTASGFLTTLGDDVQMTELQLYVAFKRIRNFVCLEIFPKARTVCAYVKVNPDTVILEPGFTRDVRKIGHFGTGDLEIVMRTIDDVRKAQSLFQRAYDGV